MAQKLDTNLSGVPKAYGYICENAFVGCMGSKEKENFEQLCTVDRGYNCSYKAYRISNLLDLTGVL